MSDATVRGNAVRGAPALFLIGHGSRSPRGVEQYWELLEGVRQMAPDVPLGGGFIELARPDVDEGLDALVASGASPIVGVPLVLLGAGHLKNDGPTALASARRRHPRTRLTYARGLGVHPLVLSLAAERIRQAAGTGASAVALIGRGSTDPDANADLYKVARLLADPGRSGGAGDRAAPRPIEAGFVSLAQPSVSEVLDRCLLLGARRIAVVPYFLFTGVLVERIADQATAWSTAHPGVEVTIGEELGPDERLARLVIERFEEAARGSAGMNCDCCLYRIALPGHERRAGAPVGSAQSWSDLTSRNSSSP